MSSAPPHDPKLAFDGQQPLKATAAKPATKPAGPPPNQGSGGKK